MSDYRPVDCGIHSMYEEAILLRRRLHLRWRTPDGKVRDESIKPLDVVARNGEEFLLLRDAAHNEISVRLDHILHCEALTKEQE